MANPILITGMSGLIGSAVRSALEDDVELRALNRSNVEGVPTTRADLADLDAIRPAFEGVDAVIHLAAKAGERFTWQELLDTNITGTRNVYQAAADAGCKRVIFASSGATVSGYEQIEPYKSLVEARYEDAPATWPLISPEMPTRPTGVYGSTKVWGEALGRHYADTTELSIICLRIGFVNRTDRPTRARDFSIWCSQRDIVDLIVKSVQIDSTTKYAVLFGTSRNKYGYRDLTNAVALAGFNPQDNAEDFR
ncbi:MAG: NAD(P)-dependent oxidoreductase [Gammaproteobacteria bacterium]|nr:NAD(P)-dependent oxidoreductase [Gammaproteobacteria bacterium]